jgi:hypothetical protein
MDKYVDKKWKDISEHDKEELLKNAICRDYLVGSALTDGDGMVCFAETLAAMGTIRDGIIQINGDEVLYNPCIGEGGKPISQEELDKMFDEYESSIPEDFENKVYQF